MPFPELVHTVDEACFRAAYGGPSGKVTALMSGITVLGSGWALLGVAPLLAPSRTRPFAWALSTSLGVTAGVVFLLKILVRRPRPCTALLDVFPPLPPPTDFSFPSGHAAGSFAFAFFVLTVLRAHLRAAGYGVREPRALLTAFACGLVLVGATAVGFSRVYLGVHYPGDVVVGALLGGVLGARGARRFLEAPRPSRPVAP